MEPLEHVGGRNWANRLSESADAVGTTAGIAGLAAGATGIGVGAMPVLEGIAGVANATSLVADMFGDGARLTPGEVASASLAMRESPAVRRAYEQGLVKRGQLADAEFVSSLEHTLDRQQSKQRRHSKGPSLSQNQRSRGRVRYYHGTRFAQK